MVKAVEFDFDVEVALLAAICSDDDVVFEVADIVAPGDFAKAEHGLIYEVLRERVLDGVPNDTVSLVADLRTRGKLEEAGGAEGVRRIIETKCGTPSSAGHYAKLVSEASKRRRVATISQKLSEQARGGGDLGVLATMLDAAMAGLSGDGARFVSRIGPAADEVRARLAAMRNGERSLDLLKTDFRELDALAKGLRAGQLIIVGARPGMGKTAFALALALRPAVRKAKRVLFFSLEMSVEELSERAVAAGAKVDLSRLQSGELDGDELGHVDRAIGELRDAELILNADPTVRVGDIRLSALRERARGGIGLIVVDYLQLMSGAAKSRGAENRQAEVAEISRSLKLLARELEVPIIALSQLSRNLESRHDKRPQLSDLRESGALEQDADLVLFLYRDELYDENSPSKGLVEVIVAKHRNGPIGKAVLFFEPEFMRYGDLLHARDVIPLNYRIESGPSGSGDAGKVVAEEEESEYGTLWGSQDVDF